MTRSPAGGRTSPRTPTLGEFTSGQLRRLGVVAGLSGSEVEAYANLLTFSLGQAAERPLDLPPPTRTFLSDDHTPVEFSLSFRPGAGPALRVLVEPGCGAGSLARNGRAGAAFVRTLAERWNFSTEAFDALGDLFLPDAPKGPLALWCALELRPGGVPGLKVYLNPAASGVKRSAGTVREALRRLGHGDGFDALPEADGHPFFALDMGDWDAPRAKVYLRHDNLTAARAGRLSRMFPGPAPAGIEEFFRTVAGAADDGGDTVLAGRPGLTCHAFTDAGEPRPTGFTLHIPVRDYARDDGEALTRAEDVLRARGMDPAPLTAALAAVTRRRPEEGLGLIAYLALAHQHGRPPRVTAYISCEAYAIRPPRALHRREALI